MAKKSLDKGICQRIAQIRMELAGPRGKSAFARQLGISPTTYQSYEQDRVPPADLLVRIADLAGLDVRWLITGKSPGQSRISAHHPALQRASKLLAQRPGAAPALGAFVELFSRAMEFPDGKTVAETSGEPPQSTSAQESFVRQELAAAALEPGGTGGVEQAQADWIPILGRSAAGVPQFWADEDDAVGITTLEELIARYGASREKRIRPATASVGPGEQENAVQMITLTSPQVGEPAEFVVAAGINARYGDAFAVRIDGQSMSPEIRHGDVVILSPSVPAVNGRSAVVQLDRQIGVTCKLYRRQEQMVHLVPINEQYEPQTYPAGQVVWALRVLARIRPSVGAA